VTQDETQASRPARPTDLVRRAILWLSAVIMLTALVGQVVAGVLPLASPTPGAPGPIAQASSPGLSHFENKWIALDYPSHLVAHEERDSDFKWHPPVHFGGQLVVGLADPAFQLNERYTRLIRISRLHPRPHQSLQSVMKENYASIDPRWRVAESPLEAPESLVVSGVAARQQTYRIHWDSVDYDLRDVWIPTDDNLFLISISTRWTEAREVASFQAHADAVLSSLVIKRQVLVARR
jgi:hypothetical protein